MYAATGLCGLCVGEEEGTKEKSEKTRREKIWMEGR